MTQDSPQIPVGVRSSAALSFWHFLDPVAAARNLWTHRDLVWQLAQREVAARYRAARLGLLWSVLTPLIQLMIYTFIFAIVLQTRWGDDANESRGEYALAMFCGMLVYNVFAEVVTRAPGLLVGAPNYVKKLVFPLETLVVSTLVSALINMLVSLGVWLVGWLLIMRTWPHITALWLPVAMIPVCLTTLGLSWLVASLGVFVRDLGHAISLFVQMLFFMTPIFYKAERVPYPYRIVLEVNPLSHAIEDARSALMWGQPPGWQWWLVTTLAALLLAQAGYAFFMKSKRAFADVV
jgi:lipopolysaccharide transport system permease protein